MNAYRVPAVSVIGLANVNVFRPPAAPSLNPSSVAVARSAPVGTGVAPVVFRIDRVMLGFAPLHAEQNSSTSTRFSWPVTVGVKVWPAQVVLLKPKPVGTDGAVLRFRVVRVRQLNAAWVRDEVTVGRNPALEGALRVVGEAAALRRRR